MSYDVQINLQFKCMKRKVSNLEKNLKIKINLTTNLIAHKLSWTAQLKKSMHSLKLMEIKSIMWLSKTTNNKTAFKQPLQIILLRLKIQLKQCQTIIILSNDMDHRYGPRSNRYNLQLCHRPKYNKLNLNIDLHESEDGLLH